ncbi:hypothetical protein AXY46_16290 [Achromobacter xylosoxidans]|nr:hypothetical protein AXY46_16290 [Achromobacter xylosoxidans]
MCVVQVPEPTGLDRMRGGPLVSVRDGAPMKGRPLRRVTQVEPSIPRVVKCDIFTEKRGQISSDHV